MDLHGRGSWRLGDPLPVASVTIGSPVVGGEYPSILHVGDGAVLAQDKLWFSVKAYGAAGDGVTDDATAIQAAVTAADAAGGGVVLFPHGKYLVGSTIDVRSYYPIWLVGEGSGESGELPGYGTHMPSAIIANATLSNGMIRYKVPDGATNRGHFGSGGVEKLVFMDATARTNAVLAALNLVDFSHGVVRDCFFEQIKGSAILCDQFIKGSIDRCCIQHCGDTGKPAIIFGLSTGSASYPTQAASIRDCLLEVNYSTYIEVGLGGQNKIIGCGFESDGTAATEFSYINTLSGVENNIIDGCHFNNNHSNHVTIASNKNVLANCTFNSLCTNDTARLIISGHYNAISAISITGTSNTGKDVLVSGQKNVIQGIAMYVAGRIDVTAAYNVLRGVTSEASTITTGSVIQVIDACAVIGCMINSSATGGILLAGGSVVCIGNQVYACTGAGITSTATTPTITGNSCSGNGTNYSLAARTAGIVSDNYLQDLESSRRLSTSYADIGNVGAGTDDLHSYTIPANSLNYVGRTIRVKAWGRTTNNANAKTVAMLFGGTTIMTQALTTNIAGTWRVEAVIVKDASNTQRIFAELLQLATIVHNQTATAGAITDTAGIIIKCTGVATDNNDIVQEGMLVEIS